MSAYIHIQRETDYKTIIRKSDLKCQTNKFDLMQIYTVYLLYHTITIKLNHESALQN